MISKVKTIKYNVVLNIIYNISNIIFPLITFPYISRILLADGTGKVSFFTSIATYATLVGSLGISTYGIRETAKVRDDKEKLSKVVQELLILNTISTIIVIILLIVSMFYIDKFRQEPLLLILNCFSIITSIIGMNWLYSGLEQYEYITKRSIIFKLLSLICVFMFVHKKEDYIIYAGINIFSIVGSYICNFYYAHRFIYFKPMKNLQFKKHLKPMLLLFASILAVSIYTNLDTVMLGFISGDEQVGLYTVAVKIKALLLTTINAISAVLLPRLSYYINEKKNDEYNYILKKSISIISIISIAFTVFFMINAKESIIFLGGPSYVNAATCMQIIMPILLISGFSNITGNQVLIPHGMDSCFMIAVVSGSIVDFILNYLLMPKLGCVGAAIATLFAELTQMSIQFIFAYRYIARNLNFKTYFKIIVSTIISSIVLLGVKLILPSNTFIVLVISSILYFGIYVIILYKLKEPLIFEYKNMLLSKFKVTNKRYLI